MKQSTYYFSHDYNARNDRKMIRLRSKLKAEGIGIYWCLVEMLYEEGGKIDFSEVPFIAEELRVKKGVIEQVILDFELFVKDDNFFWSDSVKRRLDKRLEKSEKAKESASHRWQNANAMRTHTDGNAIKKRKEKERKEKDKEMGDESPPKPKSYKRWTKEDFVEELKKYKDQYSPDTLNAFYKCFVEPNEKGRMRLQLEKTWDTNLRLQAWENRNFKK
jgi:hypothetical protein